MKYFSICLLAATLVSGGADAKSFKDMFPAEYPQITAADKAAVDRMDLKTGTIALEGGKASVTIPDGYYFLGPGDSRFVLENLWGNPADSSTLGMIFPADQSPYDQGWAAEMSYDDIGHVSDADAESQDYDALLKQMQADAVQESADRKKAGLPEVSVIGWAEPPHYDKQLRVAYWGKRLQFSGEDGETLNYNLRILGRHGVMVVNFIAAMSDLPQVKAATPAVMQMVTFNDGNRYSDYLPGVDKLAAGGIAALIAGKVVAKTGFLVLLLAFAKKGIILILAFGAAGLRWVKSRFGTPKPPQS